MATNEMRDNGVDTWVFPLVLSCMAGASTCVGAAVVFCFSPVQIQQSMSFSLSLAASVMITVSLISIGPECWQGIVEANSNNNHYTVHVWLLVERLVAFVAGCGGYMLLSKLLGSLPDPEHLFLFGNSKTTTSRTLDISSKEMIDLRQVQSIEQDDGFAPLVSQSSPKQKHLNSFDSSPSLSNMNSSDDDLDNFELENVRGSATDQPQETDARKPKKLAQTHRLRRKPSTTNTKESSDASDHHHHASRNNGRRPVMASVSARSFDVEDVNDEAAHIEEPYYNKDVPSKQQQKERSWRVAMLLFFSLLAHNFPEGLCVAASAKESPQLGITVAIGIFIHNVPEGIAIAVPCMAARPDAPWLAFWLASISGLAEPIGAIVALFLLNEAELELENVLATVAGIMIMVAVMELYPEAIRQLNSQRQQQQQPKSVLLDGNGTDLKQKPSYRSLILGTLVGMSMMIATEWYLPA